MLSLVDQGDEVIALEPFYDSYRATITMARGRCIPVRLDPPEFRLDESKLRNAVTSRSKLILLNSPHNPTGAVLSPSELAMVARVAVDHDILVVTDEVYEHLSFDEPHVPIATLPQMWDRTLTISSSGKTFSFTGWKVGWAIGPSALIDAVRTTKQFLTFVNAGPFQYAVAHALQHEMPWVADLRASLAHRRDLLCEGLTKLGLTTYRPRGTYFVTTDIAPLGWTDALTFCRELPQRAGVVAVPCSVFYDDPSGQPATLVRWTFTKQESVLRDALDRLDGTDLRLT
jgi:N-succinyldiaminopimelate aminotransferase